MKKTLPASILATGIVLGLGLANPAMAADADSGDQLGLTKANVFTTPVPPAPEYDRGMPGTPTAAAPLSATIPGAPPQVPHDIAPFTPVTVANNACLGCHSGKEKVEGMGTPMPESHYKDLRNAPEVVEKKVDGSRYICTTCHAPQANNPDLVDNTFK